MIVYRGDDKLYVPIDKIQMVQKYVGSEGANPKINKLGTAEWEKTKAKVKKTVKDIADKLIKIYANVNIYQAMLFLKILVTTCF